MYTVPSYYKLSSQPGQPQAVSVFFCLPHTIISSALKFNVVSGIMVPELPYPIDPCLRKNIVFTRKYLQFFYSIPPESFPSQV